MNNIKYPPIFVGFLPLLLGLGGILILRALHFFTSDPPSFIQTIALIACCTLLATGAVMIFLRFLRYK